MVSDFSYNKHLKGRKNPPHQYLFLPSFKIVGALAFISQNLPLFFTPLSVFSAFSVRFIILFLQNKKVHITLNNGRYGLVF